MYSGDFTEKAPQLGWIVGVFHGVDSLEMFYGDKPTSRLFLYCEYCFLWKVI